MNAFSESTGDPLLDAAIPRIRSVIACLASVIPRLSDVIPRLSDVIPRLDRGIQEGSAIPNDKASSLDTCFRRYNSAAA